MASFKRSELKGILILVLIIMVVGGLLAVTSGKLETWFGITPFGGPRLYDKIVFVSGRAGSNEIYAMNPDGSDVRRLTSNARVVGAPSVSPNGARVVFVGRTAKASQVFMVRSGGGEAELLTSATGAKQDPQFSPDGWRLAFISGGTVYVGDQDAEDLRPVLPTDEETREATIRREPLPAYKDFAWSPNGEGMAAVSVDPNAGDVLVLLPKIGGKATKIAMPGGGRATITGIAWARDREILAVSFSVRGRGSVAVVDLENKTARIIASSEKEKWARGYASPTLSPDGSRLAFSFNSPDLAARCGLLIADTQTGESRIISRGYMPYVRYSPSGEELVAVEGIVGRKSNIALVDPDTGDSRKLTSDGKSAYPVWSPPAPR